MSSSVSNFLQNYNFKGNPFAFKASDREESLPNYFVPNPYFLNVLGDPAEPACFAYFAARGYGKSAMARMITYLLNETKEYVPTLVVNFDDECFKRLLETVQGDIEKINSNLFQQKLLGVAFEELKVHSHRFPDFNIDLEITNLSNFAQQLHNNKIASIYFLIDGLDQIPNISNEIQKELRVIEPLLSDVSLLETKFLAFKFFLPIEIEQPLRANGNVRFDRLESISEGWEWRPYQLQELLQKRLEYFSGRTISFLSQMSYTPDLDERICIAAKGSPRNLIRLGGYILEHHVQYFPDQEKIVEASLISAIERLEKNLYKELSFRNIKPNIDNSTQVLLQDQPNLLYSISKEAELPALNNNSHMLLSIKDNDVYIGEKRLLSPPNGIALKLLKVLYENRGKTCTKDEIVSRTYPAEIAVTEDQLNNTVKRLRKKLKEPEPQFYIERVWGIGFRLNNYL